MTKPKILCYIPMSPKRPKLYARTIQSVMNVIWDAQIEYVFNREDNPVEMPYANICKKYNQARAMCLAGDYDALWTVEADMIVPPLTLERLTRINADVAYGLYVSRHGNHRWLAFCSVGEQIGVSLSDDRINARAAWGNVVETQGVGLGCTLIWRHVLEKIEFRRPDDSAVANDWYFALDCMQHGFVQKHDFGVVCGHIISPPSPKILWPDPDADRLYRIEFFNEAPPERIQEGERVEIVIDRLETKGIYQMQAGEAK